MRTRIVLIATLSMLGVSGVLYGQAHAHQVPGHRAQPAAARSAAPTSATATSATATARTHPKPLNAPATSPATRPPATGATTVSHPQDDSAETGHWHDHGPTTTAPSQDRAAAAAAISFMHDLARPHHHDLATWWGRLRTHLSAQAVADYQGINPANVPFTTITGPATLVPTGGDEDLVTFVAVPTDAGTYLVHLRPLPGNRYAVTRFTSPPGRH